MKVVDLSAERDRRASEAWDRYIAARAVADATLRFEDGRAAALAWNSFLGLCPASPPAAASGVTQIGRRA